VDPARLAAVLADAVRALREHPLPADVVRGAAVAVDAELLFALEGLAFRADSLAAWAAYAGSPRSLDGHRARLAAVTPASVQRAARRWLDVPVTVIGRPEVAR
jgi:predicted Zn-dependent peptidase